MTEKEEPQKPKSPNFAEMEQKVENDLHQFTFLIFIPNPSTHMVQFYIDDGSLSNYMNIDDFIKIMKTVCGYEESNKLENACMEYGTPFLYDRNKKVIKQLKSVSDGRDLHISDAKKEKEKEKLNNPTGNSIFELTKNAFNKLIQFRTTNENKK